MLIGMGVSCLFSLTIVSNIYVSCNGSITLVGKERTIVSAVVYL